MSEKLNLEIRRSVTQLTLEISRRQSSDYYDGEYEIIPKVREEQILSTREKTMRRNVRVLEIPYYETTNPNGTTVYIGE